MKCAGLLLLLMASVQGQTGRSRSVERQQMAVGNQARHIAVQAQAAALQRASVERQAKSVRAGALVPDSLVDPAAVPWTRAGEAPANCERLDPARLVPLLEASAREAAVSPEVLLAVIRKESDFMPCAISSAGAMGLMQLMPGTAGALGVTDPFDPIENVQAGSRFLGSMLERYNGDLSLALGAYNAGPGRVDAFRGVPPLRETQNYVSDILRVLGGAGSIWESRAVP